MCFTILAVRGGSQLVPAVRAVQDWARAHAATLDQLLTATCCAALLFFLRDYVQSLGTKLQSMVLRFSTARKHPATDGDRGRDAMSAPETARKTP